MLYKEEVRMIMIIETVLVSVGLSTFIFGMTGFSVFINKMEEADNIKQGLKMLAFAILSMLSCYTQSVKLLCSYICFNGSD